MRAANNRYLGHSSVDLKLHFTLNRSTSNRLHERGEQSLPCETDELLKESFLPIRKWWG
jgi:hypothetical protein